MCRAVATGDLPLGYFAADGNVEGLELLLRAGASVNAIERDGWTALAHAAEAGETVAVRRLLEAGARTDLTYDGLSVVELARRLGHTDTAELLAAWQADG